MPERLAKIGGWIALALCGLGLVRLIAIHNLGAVVFFVPAAAGGLLAVLRPSRRGLLILLAALMFANGYVLMLGGEGILLLPSVVLVAIASIRAKRPARISAEHA
jgi:hypothetical protein